MTEAMPFLQKAILLSYDPRPFVRGFFDYRKTNLPLSDPRTQKNSRQFEKLFLNGLHDLEKSAT